MTDEIIKELWQIKETPENMATTSVPSLLISNPKSGPWVSRL